MIQKKILGNTEKFQTICCNNYNNTLFYVMFRFMYCNPVEYSKHVSREFHNFFSIEYML